MNNEKGITLISLVVTIVVLLIITGIGTYSGIEVIKSVRKTSYVSEIEMIQAKVNNIYEKMKNNQAEKDYYNTIGKDLTNISQEKLNEIFKGGSQDGFKYFSKSELKQLDLENINQEVLINYDTREVISLSGIDINGVVFYRLKDMPGYKGISVEYIDSNNISPSFNVDVVKQQNIWIFTIKDIVYNSNVTSGMISYKRQDEKDWILIGEITNFTVNNPGWYDVKLTDKAGNSTIVQKFVGEEYSYVKDKLLTYYDFRNSRNTDNKWEDLSGNQKNATLYNYTSSNWKQDGLEFNGINAYAELPIDTTTDFAGEITFTVTFNALDGSNYRGIIGNYSNSNIQGLYMQFQNGKFLTGYGNSTTWTEVELDSSKILNKNIQLTVVYKQSNYIKIYINGELVTTRTGIPGNILIQDNLYIGRANSDTNNSYFKGKIQNILIYNKVLTEEEININYKIDQQRFGI